MEDRLLTRRALLAMGGSLAVAAGLESCLIAGDPLPWASHPL